MLALPQSFAVLLVAPSGRFAKTQLQLRRHLSEVRLTQSTKNVLAMPLVQVPLAATGRLDTPLSPPTLANMILMQVLQTNPAMGPRYTLQFLVWLCTLSPQLLQYSSGSSSSLAHSWQAS
jgi:hypothetical protein